MKTFEARGDCVSLPRQEFPLVVTGVEVLEAPECGWLVAVRGCTEQLRIFDDARRAPYPMHLWVPARQRVWFKIVLLGLDRTSPVVRMRVHYRAAELDEPGSRMEYERKGPGER